MLHEALASLVEGRDLDREAMRVAVRAIMTGDAHEVDVAAFLTALRTKGETAEELAAAVEVLRENMVRLDAGRDEVLDTCGTGGDAKGTFNISTAAGLVAAACGVPVVKHGNRGVSSASGSADVLTALGVKIDPEIDIVRRSLREAGFAFCFAPRFHPAMKHVAPVRQRLKFRTIFNLMGPLSNPAGAKYQLLGVGRAEWLDTMAECLARLDGTNAYLVCGADGLDEVTLSGPTLVRHVQPGRVRRLEWTPEDFGLPGGDLTALHAGGPEPSAAIVRAVLAGQKGPAADVVLANVAAALLAAQRVTSLKDGVQLARQALTEGRARQLLEQVVKISHGR